MYSTPDDNRGANRCSFAKFGITRLTTQQAVRHFVRKNTAYTTLFFPLSQQLVHWKYLAKFQAQTAEQSMIWGERPN